MPSSIFRVPYTPILFRPPRRGSLKGQEKIRLYGRRTATELLAVGEGFMDEEALFAMPKPLENMAEAMLLSPPRLNSSEFKDSPDNSDGESLWSYG